MVLAVEVQRNSVSMNKEIESAERRALIAASGMAKRISSRITFPKLYCNCPPKDVKQLSGRYSWNSYVEYCDNCKLLIKQDES
jgi:hypothetical protein